MKKDIIRRLLSGNEYCQVPKRIARKYGMITAGLLSEMLGLWDYFSD